MLRDSDTGEARAVCGFEVDGCSFRLSDQEYFLDLEFPIDQRNQ